MRKFVRRFSTMCTLASVLGIAATALPQDKPAEKAAAKPSEEPAEKLAVKPQWEIVAECQMIVLPQKAALPLIPDLSDDARIEAAFGTLQQLIGRGEATLFATLIARAGAGKRLTAESIEELRYPTEFDPPQVPTNVPQDKALEILRAWPVVGITPSAFETRNVGATLELDSAVSDDGQWVASLGVASHVRFVRFAKYDAGILPSGEKLSVEQPLFSTLKNTMSLQMRSGQRVLIGTHKVPGEENTMELFFLRIRTHKTGTAP